MIKLNKNFYDLKSIEESAEAFKELCSATIENTEGELYYRVSLDCRQKEHAETIAKEFSNFCLGKSKEKYPTHRIITEEN